MNPRDFLNKLKWHPEKKLEDAKIIIRHRGAPRDQKTIEGKDIEDLGSGFMKVKSDFKTVKIPYHRILKIKKAGETIWKESP